MKWLHNILKGVSLTGALFVFQACYGMPQPPLWEDGGDAPMTFSILSRDSSTPLEGINVSVRTYGNNLHKLGSTDASGKCRVEIPYGRNFDGPFVVFEDPAGKYASRDTSLADLRDRTIEIKMTPAAE